MKNVTNKQIETKPLSASQKHPGQKQDVFISSDSKSSTIKSLSFSAAQVSQSARSLLSFYSLNGKSLSMPVLAEKTLDTMLMQLGNLGTPLVRQRALALFYQLWQGEAFSPATHNLLLNLVKNFKSLAKVDPYKESKTEKETENPQEQKDSDLLFIQSDIQKTLGWRNYEQECARGKKDYIWKSFVLSTDSLEHGGFQGHLRFGLSTVQKNNLRIAVDFFNEDWFVAFYWEDKKRSILRYRAYPEHIWSSDAIKKLSSYLPRSSFERIEAMQSQDWYDGFNFFPNNHIMHNVDVLQ